MNMKKIAPIFALILTLSSFAACGNTEEKVPFGDYWRYTSLETTAFSETLVYSVDEKEPLSISYNFDLAYENGTYTTSLTFDTNTNVYTYVTELSIDAVYEYANEKAPLHDSVVTETKFHSSKNALTPISSKKRVVSHSPLNRDVTKLSDCYQTWNYSIETTYAAKAETANSVVTYYKVETNDGKETITNEVDGTPTQTGDVAIDHSKYSCLDNEQLPLAIRAIPTNVSSAKVNVINPFAKATQNVSLTFSTEESAQFTFTRGGENVTNTLTYRPVSMVLNERNPGGTHTIWVAKAADQQKNEYRNVILKMETPIYYAYGALVYTLTSVSW